MAFDDIGNHEFNGPRAKGRDIALTDALNPVVGDQLYKNEVAPAFSGWRVANHKCTRIGNLHRLFPEMISIEHDDVAKHIALFDFSDCFIDLFQGIGP